MNVFSRHKNIILLAVLLLTQLIVLAAQVKRQTPSGAETVLRGWATALVSPFEKTMIYTGTGIRRGWSNYFYLRNISKQNDQLRAQIDQMRIEQTRMREDARQARRIQALLAFKEQYVDKTVAAQVIGTSGTESSRLITIDKGTNDGVRPNMPVITPDGIVGKVLNAYGSTSQVLEITDQSSGVGAILTNSRLQGIVKGSPTGEVILNYIMADEQVKPGDEVVTSGGDKIFPKGLPVGRVEDVSTGRDLFLRIKLKPAADVNRLEEVLVITEMSRRETDTKDLGPIRAADILAEHLPSVPPQPTPGANGQPAAGAAPTQPAPGAANKPGTPAATPAAPATTPKPNANSGAAPTATKPAGSTSPTAQKPATTGAAQTKPTVPATPKPRVQAPAGAQGSEAR